MPKNEGPAENRISIEVLGTSISIAADEEPEYLNYLLETYRKAVKNTQVSTGLKDPLKTAVLTGFLLCDEVEKAKREKTPVQKADDADAGEAEKLALNLISRLNSVFDEPETPAESRKKAGIFKLENAVQHYDWGSPAWIPDLLGKRNVSRVPWAELWMGVHPGGPSRLAAGKGATDTAAPLLQDIISEDPGFCLGQETEKTYGALPFLFKILAAGRPLSIQAHPYLDQAKEGWDRENNEGIDLKASNRNYKDANHKPEIICALTSFTAMCGFRKPEEIKTLLDIFNGDAPHILKPAVASLASALIAMDGDSPLKSFLRALFALDGEARKALSAYAQNRWLETEYPQYKDEWKLVRWFAELYPGDPAVIAPLYLNLVCLEPGEAVYLPAGVLHAYIYGLGVELMANSDNVLRGGLTPKHIDVQELFRVLKFSPFKPEILKPSAGGGAGSFCYRYPAPCGEFSLSCLSGGELAYNEKGPSIVIVTEGTLKITGGLEDASLEKGESAFIPAGEAAKGLTFSGAYTVYAAGVGRAAGIGA
jgi:mannose-6-phosphate isomerase